MHPALLHICTVVASMQVDLGDKLRDERGEGVVSVAIAVLIMAALGAVAWGLFDTLFRDTVDQADTQIGTIGG